MNRWDRSGGELLIHELARSGDEERHSSGAVATMPYMPLLHLHFSTSLLLSIPLMIETIFSFAFSLFVLSFVDGALQFFDALRTMSDHIKYLRRPYHPSH